MNGDDTLWNTKCIQVNSTDTLRYGGCARLCMKTGPRPTDFQTVNMILKRFEKEGYVELTVNDMDKRSKFIKLTDKGSKASTELIADLLSIEIDTVKEMGIDKFRQMNDVQEEYIKLFNKYADF